MKPVPLTVRVKAAEPAVALDGESEVSAGTGLAGAEMVNGSTPEVPPPGAGFDTVTFAVLTEAMSAAVIAAVSCVALTNVVARFAPFHWTTEAAMKPVPLTVRVKAAEPAVALDGRSEVSAGTGFAGAEMVNASTPEVPPPGAGFETVTFAVL